MRIEGLPLDSGGVRNITEKKTPKPAPADTTITTDTVEITGGMGKKELVDTAATVPAEFPVREDVIEAVARRVSAGAYDTPETTEKVAERLIESPALSGAVFEAAGAGPAPARTEAVETAEPRASSGYYDRPEIITAVAEQLVNVLGLSSLFGK